MAPNEWEAWFCMGDRWAVRPVKKGMFTHYEVYNPAKDKKTKAFPNLKDALWHAAKLNTENE